MGTTFRTHVNPSSRSKETENFCRTRPIHKRAVIRARLRSGRASEQEVELTLFGAGWVASDSDRWRERLALVHIDDEWKLAIPSTSNFYGRTPDPRCASQVLSSVQPCSLAAEGMASPRCRWIRDFAPSQ